MKYVKLLPTLLVPILLFGIYSNVKSKPVAQKQPAYVAKPLPVYVPPTIESLNEAVNKERTDRGLAPLQLTNTLNQSALEKASEMIREGQQPNPHVNIAGEQGYKKIAKYQTNCTYISENLSTYSIENIATTSVTVSGLMSSPAHRAAILDPENDLVGYAVLGRFVVQHFCKL